MEGLMFYFISWSMWVYLTFIMKKENPLRVKLSVAVLTCISLAAAVPITIGRFEVSAIGLFMLIVTYMALRQENSKTLLYFYICSFILTIAYVTFCLFEIFDPVWLIFNKDWMLAVCLGYLAILLQKKLRGRLLLLISGTMQGEILYAYILGKYNFHYSIGSFAYLDAFSLTAILLVGWSGMEKIGSYFEQSVLAANKGKQKSS